jgi:hypothetical protein
MIQYCVVKNDKVKNIQDSPFKGGMPLITPDYEAEEGKVLAGYTYFIYPTKVLAKPVFMDLSEKEKAKKARKKKEDSEFVRWGNRRFLPDVETITMLSAYIVAQPTKNIHWKCVKGWKTISLEEAQELLTLLVEARNALFKEERQNSGPEEEDPEE